MGVTAKQFGKLGSMLAKIDAEKEKEHKDANQAKSKKDKKDNVKS